MVSSALRIASASLARSATTTAPRVAVASAPLRLAAATASPSARFAFKAPTVAAVRGYAAGSSLSQEEIKTRIIDVLKSFEKVKQSRVFPDAHFTESLGLDSLDVVEVVMAIEEEFNIEIPDADADAIQTVGEAIEYISKTPEAS